MLSKKDDKTVVWCMSLGFLIALLIFFSFLFLSGCAGYRIISKSDLNLVRITSQEVGYIKALRGEKLSVKEELKK